MDFDTECMLSRLPVDPIGVGASSVVAPSVSLHKGQRSVVEMYVHDVVEMVPSLDVTTYDLDDLSEVLFEAGVPPPVIGEDLVQALVDMPKDTAAKFKKIPDFIPRALKALNGPDFCLVGHEELAEAMDKEAVMRGMPRGWGVCDPPVQAIAHRLLVASGVDPTHLPKYKTLPPSIRAPFMNAWHGACKVLGWSAYDPDSDVSAEARTQSAIALGVERHTGKCTGVAGKNPRKRKVDG